MRWMDQGEAGKTARHLNHSEAGSIKQTAREAPEAGQTEYEGLLVVRCCLDFRQDPG